MLCNGQQTADNGLERKPNMTTVQPEGEDLRKATRWIAEERKYNPERKLSELIEEACLKFDLSPMDEEFLFRILKDQK
jgi:hypothetical protein